MFCVDFLSICPFSTAGVAVFPVYVTPREVQKNLQSKSVGGEPAVLDSSVIALRQVALVSEINHLWQDSWMSERFCLIYLC